MKKTALVLSLLLTGAALAQSDVVVKQVNDRRSQGFFSQLSIYVELPKVKSSEVAASRVVVTSATDETGLNLVDPEAAPPEFMPHMGRAHKNDDPVGVSVTVKTPARKATKVKEVRGEIELMMPGRDPNSIAEIAKFTSSPGKPLSHKALKANGIEIALISPSQLEAEKKKKAEAKKKEYAEMGYEGDELTTMVNDYLSSMPGSDENDLFVRLKDPQKRLEQITYVDAAGEEKPVSVREEEGMTVFSTWAGKPQADWKMVVKMRTAKNLVKVPFTLKDVPLP